MENQATESVKKKRKGIKALVILAIIAVVISVVVVMWLAWLDAEYINVHAMRIVDTPVSENNIGDLLAVEKEYAEASPLARMFFSYKDEIAERRAAYNVLIEKRAGEISAEIDALPTYTKIESKEQYEQIVTSIAAVQLNPQDAFTGEVYKAVDNYDKLEQYIQQVAALRDNYKQDCMECNQAGYTSCESCNGKGKTKCTSCNGSGKLSQAWHEYGDYGDTSYTNSTCSNCGGSGKEDCSFCDYGREDCPCEDGYVYVYEDGK